MSEIAKAYSRLSALVQTIEALGTAGIEDRYVDEYHEIVDKLASEVKHLDLVEFRIPARDLLLTSTVRVTFAGRRVPRFAMVRHVDRAILLLRARALLTYFTVATSEPARQIGFQPPAR